MLGTHMLKFNRQQQAFVLTSDDEERAKDCGLTLSTITRGAKGEKVWYTADVHRQPLHNPYAVLPFFAEADNDARSMLTRLRDTYQSSWAKTSSFEPPAPAGCVYHPFQKAGIEYAVGRRNSLIGDQPGLGKTVQAIGFANTIEAKRVLVIVPGSIRIQWQRMIRLWSTIPNVTTYPVLKSKDGVNPFVNYVIISYDLTRNPAIHDVLCNVPWDVLILDEAHFLKNNEAKRTRAVFGGGDGMFKTQCIADHADRIIALTGTPLPNRPRECYTLARGLDFESIDWMSEERFQERFNPSVMNKYSGGITEAKGRLPELQNRLRCNFMVRRLKKDVLTDLPEIQLEFVYVENNGAINKVLAKEKLLDFEPGEVFNGDFEMDGPISTVRREMGEAMVPRIAEHVKYLLDIVEEPKIVLFNHHRSVMDELHEILAKYGLVSVRGGMTPQAKQEAIDEFRTNSSIRIFSGQNDSAGLGTDGLQDVASYAVIGEPSWRPGDNEQMVDRLHRMGQANRVLAQFLLVENSFNEMILGTVLDKAHAIHKVLDRRTA